MTAPGPAEDAGRDASGDKLPERQLFVETAKALAEQGHLAQAIEFYERAERSDEKQGSLDRALAPLYAQTGNFEAAIGRYQRAVEAAPADIELRNNYAWTLVEAGRYAEAERELKEALEESPQDERLPSTLAVAYFHSGRPDAAYEQFARLHGSAGAHHNMAVLALDQGDLVAASHAIGQARAVGPLPETLKLQAALDRQLAPRRSSLAASAVRAHGENRPQQ